MNWAEFEFLFPLQFQEIVRFSSLPHDIIDSVAPNQKYWVAEVIPFSILGLQELPKILMPRCEIIVRCGENVGKILYKNGLQVSVGHLLVPGAGIEPARIAPLVFETSASTDSAIRAGVW